MHPRAPGAVRLSTRHPFPMLEPQIVTPLIPLQRAGRPRILVKLEYLNPSGSTKDRIARFMLTKALREGRVAPGGRVVEASSGSTSIAMAMACARLGLRFMAVMPAGVSSERSLMIQAYGGEVRLAPAGAGIGECVRLAAAIAAAEGAWCPRQFENPDNAAAHRIGTAREAVEQLPGGRCDAVVAGVGTGGTLVGLWQGLADHGVRARPVLARPVAVGPGARLCAGCFTDAECAFSSRVPGVVDGMSRIFDPAAMPDLATEEVRDDEAIAAARELIGMGLPVGPSSGLNVVAAERTAARLAAEGRAEPAVFTVLCDRMERYFSTELFAPWRG